MRSSPRCSQSDDQVSTKVLQRCRYVLIDCYSVIDKETQYFIAEATKTLTLSDTRKSESDGDGLWVGCTSVPKEGRLCEVQTL